MLAGFATAQAQSVPSSGAADLWLFVADTTASTTFAEDLGTNFSLSSLLPTASLMPSASANPSLSTSISAQFSVGPSAALATYLSTAEAAGHTIEWAVDGIQYPTNTNATKAHAAPGGIVDVTNELASQSSNLAQLSFANIQTIGNGFSADVTYLSPTYVAGGSTYAWSTGTTSGNVWGSNTGDNSGSTDLFGQGPDQAGIALGTATTLFGLTGNGGAATLQSYVLGTDLTLSSTGTLSVGSSTPPPVPLPAAVWLFGSGLLGLIGVGRRRAATAA
jgi:hypothetical protein